MQMQNFLQNFTNQIEEKYTLNLINIKILFLLFNFCENYFQILNKF